MGGRGKWSGRVLAVYFVLFLCFLYGPSILMAILSFNEGQGITFPMEGFSTVWWQSIFDSDINPFINHADEIREAGQSSLWLALVAGVVTAIVAFTLSYAFRRRFRLDGVVFYLVMLCLMTPGFLLGLGTAVFWQTMGISTDMWRTALGTNVIWALPFAFLVMVAVWNRYDKHIEEAARDLGADAKTTFREVTLPLVWTGIFGCLLFGFTLSWNEYDRTVLALSSSQTTLPIQIFSFTTGSVLRPDVYALGTGTTAISLVAMGLLVLVGILRLRRTGKRASLATQVQEELGQVVTTDLAEEPGTAGAGGRAT
jgi:putative spermidine/putrescine transport system permease protein